jgi:hypothetical protein
LSKGLQLRTQSDGSVTCWFSDEKGVAVRVLGGADDGAGYSVEIDAWGEGAPRLAAVVTVRARTEGAAVRKAAGAALLFYEEDEAWPPAELRSAAP